MIKLNNNNTNNNYKNEPRKALKQLCQDDEKLIIVKCYFFSFLHNENELNSVLSGYFKTLLINFIEFRKEDVKILIKDANLCF